MQKENKYIIKEKTFVKFIGRIQINKVVREIAKSINTDYKGKRPLFLVVLKGSMFFAADLLRMIKIPCEMETVTARSYGRKMKSSGYVELNTKKLEINRRHVIVVEDIVDTGLTIHTLTEVLKQQKPASLEVCSFLSKSSERKVEISVKYVGMEIPPEFVIGYGLDYAEQGRHLPDLYHLLS